MNKLLIVAAAGTLFFACKPKGLTDLGPTGSNLSSIQIGKPNVSEENYYDTASISLSCMNCTEKTEGGNIIDKKDELVVEKKAFDALMTDLDSYKFTEGRQIKINLTFYKADKAVLTTCEGTDAGCADYVHTLAKEAGSDTFKVKVRLKDMGGNTVETGDEAANVEVETEIIDNDGAQDEAQGEDVKVELTSLQSEATDAVSGHCIVEYEGGVHGGQKLGNTCLIGFGADVIEITEGIKYIKANPAIEFKLVSSSTLANEKRVVVGTEKRISTATSTLQDFPIYVCASGTSMGKTSTKEDGTNNLWDSCHFGADAVGAKSATVIERANFQVLTYQAK